MKSRRKNIILSRKHFSWMPTTHLQTIWAIFWLISSRFTVLISAMCFRKYYGRYRYYKIYLRYTFCFAFIGLWSLCVVNFLRIHPVLKIIPINSEWTEMTLLSVKPARDDDAHCRLSIILISNFSEPNLQKFQFLCNNFFHKHRNDHPHHH